MLKTAKESTRASKSTSTTRSISKARTVTSNSTAKDRQARTTLVKQAKKAHYQQQPTISTSTASEILQAHNVGDDDLALVRLVVNAALAHRRKRKTHTLLYVKHQLDTTLRPTHNGATGEWSVLLLNGWLGGSFIACSMYVLVYIPEWRQLLVLFYA